MHQRLGSEIFHWGSDHRAYVQLWLQHPATLGQHPCADCLLRPKRDFDLKDVHHDIWHHWDLLISFKWKTRRFRIWNSIWIKALSHAATSLDFVELLSHARTRYDCDLGPGTIVISSHPPGLEHPAASEQVKSAHRMKQWTKASDLTRCQHQWHIDAQQLRQVAKDDDMCKKCQVLVPPTNMCIESYLQDIAQINNEYMISDTIRIYMILMHKSK